MQQSDTGSFKGLCLKPFVFYLVILPVGTKWALIEYHTKAIAMAKTIGFRQGLEIT